MLEETKKVKAENTEPEEEVDEEEFDLYQALRDFFKAYKDDIGSIIRAIGSNIEKGPIMRFWAMAATFLMLAFIVSILAWLTFLEILSGETLAFLCGTIIGYMFSFLKTYVVGVR